MRGGARGGGKVTAQCELLARELARALAAQGRLERRVRELEAERYRLRRELAQERGAMLNDPQVARQLNIAEKFFIGIATDPMVVAATRAVVLYGLPLGTEAVVAWSHSWPPAFVPLGVATAMLARALEGAVDRQLKGVNQNRPKSAHRSGIE